MSLIVLVAALINVSRALLAIDEMALIPIRSCAVSNTCKNVVSVVDRTVPPVNAYDVEDSFVDPKIVMPEAMKDVRDTVCSNRRDRVAFSMLRVA